MINKRVKLLFIPKWQVLDCVLNPIPRMVSVIQHEELPKEYEILGVSYDFCRDGFIFKLSHPSWPEVEEGEIPEIINKIATITKLYSVHPYKPQPSAKDMECEISDKCNGCEHHEAYYDEGSDGRMYHDGCTCNSIDDQYHIYAAETCPYYRKTT